MLQNNSRRNSPKPADYVVTYGLWLVTAGLALWEILIAYDVTGSVYARIIAGRSDIPESLAYSQAVLLSQSVVIFMVIATIAIIIGGLEYHHQHVGEAQSLKVLRWTLGIQFLLLALSLLA